MRTNKIFLGSLILLVVLVTVAIFNYCYMATGEEQLTQGKFIIKMINFMRLEYRLPKDATINDYVNLLREEGFTIPEDFKPDIKITKELKASLLSQLINRDSTAAKQYSSKFDVYRDRALIEKIEGKVSVKLSDKIDWIPAEVNMYLTEGDTIKTEANSIVYLRVGVAGRVVIKENTELLLRELATETDKKSERILMYLALGEMTVDVRYIEKDSVVETYTPSAVAAVRGTIYTVTVSPVDGKTEIREVQ